MDAKDVDTEKAMLAWLDENFKQQPLDAVIGTAESIVRRVGVADPEAGHGIEDCLMRWALRQIGDQTLPAQDAAVLARRIAALAAEPRSRWYA